MVSGSERARYMVVSTHNYHNRGTIYCDYLPPKLQALVYDIWREVPEIDARSVLAGSDTNTHSSVKGLSGGVSNTTSRTKIEFAQHSCTVFV